jgi:hypothetical protein
VTLNISADSVAAPRASRPERRRARDFRAVVALATACLVAVLLAGCGGVRIRPADEVPPPLVDELPIRAGVYYGAEFREYVHREERWGTKWEVQLGAAHVTKLGRLLKAMFPTLVDVPDLAKPPAPALDLILEPRFEEYSFVTPRDAGGEFYAVTIKYRMNLYDGAGRLIDSLVYTGYGSVAGGGLSSETPLMQATQKAMRDAGAKFATEFEDQPSVKTIASGGKVEPVATGTSAPASGGIGEVQPTAPATPPAGVPASGGPVAPAPASPAPAAPASGEAAPAAPAAPTNEAGAGTPPAAPGPDAAAPASAPSTPAPAPGAEAPPLTPPSTPATETPPPATAPPPG